MISRVLGLFDKDGNKICWEYIVELQKLQDEEGLCLGNKLKFAHIKWQQQKMKVDLAAQSLSSSIAHAIEYCANVLKLSQFQAGADPGFFLTDASSVGVSEKLTLTLTLTLSTKSTSFLGGVQGHGLSGKFSNLEPRKCDFPRSGSNN